MEDDRERLEALLDEGERLTEDCERHDLAEAHFRRALERSRDVLPEVEMRALNDLSTLYAREERHFECLVLGRVMVERAQAMGNTPGVCKGLLGVAGALQCFEDWERMSPVLEQFEARIEGLSVEQGRMFMLVFLRGMKAARACGLGRFDASQAAIDEIQAMRAVLDFTPNLERYLQDLQARLGRRSHDLQGLRTTLAAAQELDVPMALGGLDMLDHACWLALEEGDEGQARRQAQGLFEQLCDRPEQRFGLALTHRMGSAVAETFGSLEEPQLANRAYEVASTAVARRILQIERSIESLPELQEVGEEDGAAAARYRLRFVGEQSSLLGAVAQLFRDHADLAREVLDPHRAESGLVPVCAWCQSVRDTSGHWAPIGHLVPTSPDLSLTHTICPACRLDPQRGMAIGRNRRRGT